MAAKTSEKSSPRSPARGQIRNGNLKIVGIGASAGGLEAYTELLRHLPGDLDVGYVLVQHLDPTHPSLLSELLAKTTSIPVREIADRTRVEAGNVYVIPPNCDLTIEDGVLRLAPRDKSGGPARSIDHFLLSLARDQKENAIAIVLSGAGSDGAHGLKAVKDAGGITFAQDEATAKYDSMPRSAVGTGCVDFVLPPSKIGEEIGRLLHRPGRTKRRAAANARDRRGKVSRKPAASAGRNGHATAPWPAAPEDINLRKIFLLLRTRTGTDFALYRLNTIRRRLARRVAMHKLKSLEAYARFLREHPDELEALYQDILINVTTFFRNPAVFDALKRKVFPRLLKNNTSGDALRIWVAGCSTGQEAYSLAMAYTEFAEQAGSPQPIQIFATDLNGSVLDFARAGRYTRAQVESVTAARLQRFFTPEGDHYRVQKAVRDMVIFAQQNLLVDPPFTRVDLITCRNLLIYLEPALQQRIIPAFHYALKPGGVLVLGTSESVGQFTTLFEPLEKNQKIYLKKPAANWLRFERPPALPVTKSLRTTNAAPRPPEPKPLDAFKEADRLTLAKYAPVSVLVSEDGEILQFRGDVHRYLELPSGKASFQLLKMAREGLALPLQKAFLRAKRDNKVVRERGLRFDARRATVNVEIVPLKNLRPRCFLVLFQKPAAAPKADGPGDLDGGGARPGRGRNGHDRGGARELESLRQEFTETREQLVTLQEAHDTSVEELQASNEEVQSANEELQSLNEELETSNEELESANEELTTLNEELATRNAELRESEQRLREQSQLLEMAPVLVRSPKDRIIFWNRGAEKLYGYTKEEAMDQTSHLLLGAQLPEPLEKIEKELHRRGQWDGEVLHRRKDGQVICVASQWVVHHDANRKIRAILQVDTDITARKEAEKALRESESFNRGILASSPDCLMVLDLAGRVVFISPGGLAALETDDIATYAHTYWPNFWEGEHRAEAEDAYRAALTGESPRFHAPSRTHKGALKWWDVAVRPILGAAERPEKLLVVARDITEQRVNELAREEEARLALLRADIASHVARAGDAQPILQEIAETLLRHLHVAGVRILTAAGDAPLLLQASAGAAPPGHGIHSPNTEGEFKLAAVFAARKPFLSNDLAGEGEFADPEWARREGLVAFAGYPLLFESEAMGVITVVARHTLEPRILKELKLAGDAIAQYLHRKAADEERTRLLKEAMEARNEVEVLNEIGKTLAAELDQQKLAQAVVDAATRLTKADYGAIFYQSTDDHGETHGWWAGAGVARDPLSAPAPPRKVSGFVPVLAGKAVIRAADFTNDPRAANEPLHQEIAVAARSYLAAPIVGRSGDVIGRLCFTHARAGLFGDREERLVLNLASQAAIAMDNARLVDNLERKVTERTARLQETVSELQAFSYTVSHDLRAPLRAMQSYAQVLLEDCADELNDTCKEYLTRIEHAGVRLDRLIQDVLTYSRIARSQVAIQALDLEKLVQDIMQQYPNLRPPNAEIRVQGPLPSVLAEESSATQCLSNLLGNAVKFVPRDRQPVVTIRAEPHGRDYTRLWIEDNGIGIDPQDHERIFKMFERVGPNNGYEGTGIGLAIVRKAIERMGGQVGVVSRPGEGSRFWLDFRSVPS